MKPNVGGADRALRIVIGLVLLALGAFVIESTGWTIAFLVVGAILFLTGLTRICCAYIPFKINTSKKE
jgi:hypothetical protein